VSYLRLMAIAMAVVFISSCAAKAPSPALCTAIGVALGGAGGVAAGDGQGPGDDEEAKVAYGVGGAVVGGLLGYGICSYFAEEPPPPPPAPKPVAGPDPCGGAVRLYGINFALNKATIQPGSFKILDQLVEALKRCPAKVIKIEGHTDSTGSDAYNMQLSDRRAASVKDYLVQHGIAASALEAQGFGESRPIASNDTAEGRAENRRVEMKPIR